MSENRIQQANGYFKKNSDLKAVYFTEDGQAFFNENYAINHNKKLTQGKSPIETITRESLALQEVVSGAGTGELKTGGENTGELKTGGENAGGENSGGEKTGGENAGGENAGGENAGDTKSAGKKK